MPEWIQITIAIVQGVFLLPIAYLFIKVAQIEAEIAKINERCHNREGTICTIASDLRKTNEALHRATEAMARISGRLNSEYRGPGI
jgi:hypothetical protein